jgi:tRNA(fMet)-specific endonuclease VapC
LIERLWKFVKKECLYSEYYATFVFKRDTRAEHYRVHLEGNVLAVSFQTVAELYQWAETAHWGQDRRARLRQWLGRFAALGYDDDTAQIWARVCAERERQGQPIAAQDAWVAACALRHSCPLVTHNAGDYKELAVTRQTDEQAFVVHRPRAQAGRAQSILMASLRD